MGFYTKKICYVIIWILVFYFVFRATIFICSNTIENFIESHGLLNAIVMFLVVIVDPVLTTLIARFIEENFLKKILK